MLIARSAARFGACFGTPLAGAIFALEVLAAGRITSDAVIPALAAGSIADLVCQAWGAPHTHYRIDSLEQVVEWREHIAFNLWLSVKMPVATALVGQLPGGESAQLALYSMNGEADDEDSVERVVPGPPGGVWSSGAGG